MHLGRVIGRLVATHKTPGLSGVPLQIIQPLDENGAPSGATLVATSAISSGPGDVITWIDGREAALTCPVAFVPIDAAILGFAEQIARLGETIARQES